MSNQDDLAAESGARLVLRAELSDRGRHIVAHTTQLAASWVAVRTDMHLEIGARLQLQLSFPRLFAPLELDARVDSRDAGSGHGYQPVVRLDLVGPPEQRERLMPLLRELETQTGARRRCRILLVEDSPIMRDSVEHGASRLAGQVEVATSSTQSEAEALLLLEREPPDLALVDFFLPGPRSGAELVREMRARGLDVPVIGYSVGGPGARDAFLAAGADLFLDKPVIVRDIFRTLQRLTAAAAQ